MKIVIVGAGKVGKSIGKRLTGEDHDIAFVDNNADVLNRIINEMDVQCVVGNGADYRVLCDAGVTGADVLIAATAHDEINMICCLLGHKLGVKRTIARVRDPMNADQLGFLKEELGLSLAINPELEAAREISRLLRIPSALSVEVFAGGKVELVGVRLSANNPLCGMSLYEVNKKYKAKVLVCAVQRGNDCYIPNGNFVLAAGDKLHFTAPPKDMSDFLHTAYPNKQRKIKSVMICGGGRITYYLAKNLIMEGITPTIIESDLTRANFLVDEFGRRINVIHGQITDNDLLLELGISSVDAFVALTGMDETNIISGISAKWKGAGNVIAKVNNEELVSAIPADLIDALISPKQITSNQILSFVRAMSCSPEESNVETVHELVGGRIEALDFIAKGNHPMYGVPLKKLNHYMHKDLLVAAIVRDGKVIIPDGNECILQGDSVVIVAKHRMLNDLADILSNTPRSDKA